MSGRYAGSAAPELDPDLIYGDRFAPPRRAPGGISRARAMAIAEEVHAGQVEPSGRPYIEHVRRVAADAPPEAVGVAWLHDALERSEVSEARLAAAGLSAQEREALRLLTHRGVEERDDATFLSHVRIIAATPGGAGRIARAVKRADMEDRMRTPRDPNAAWRPPYREALYLLAREGGSIGGNASLPITPNDPKGTPR